MSKQDDEIRAIIEKEMVRIQKKLSKRPRSVPDPERLAAAAARGDLDPNPAVVKMISDLVSQSRKQERDAAKHSTTQS